MSNDNGIKINDEFLLTQVIEFCDNGKYSLDKIDNNLKAPIEHPLDGIMKMQLEDLKSKSEKYNQNGSPFEISYMTNEEIEKIWYLLIEKSIICLRYFDGREPFKENGKTPFVYGMEELNKYHKDYIKFEGVLYGSNAYYRDHVFHVFRCWLMGVYCLLNNNTHIISDKKRLIDLVHFEGENIEDKLEEIDNAKLKTFGVDENIKEKLKSKTMLVKDDEKYKILSMKDNKYYLSPSSNFSKYINLYEKISMWTLISLCHDLGYPLEKSQSILENTKKMMGAFISRPQVWSDFEFSNNQDCNNQCIVKFMSKKMKINQQLLEEPQYKSSVQSKYEFKYNSSLEKYAHGIISAIILYKMLIYFKESDNNENDNYLFSYEDARQFYIRREILRSMSSHTCKDIYHIDIATFPALLFICDELQEWGRKSWKNLYQGLTNTSVKLEIEKFNTKAVKFREDINMESVTESQLVDNIKRIFENQYLLYQTIFRDGQFTAIRKFDMTKEIEVTVPKKYATIKNIKIIFNINHKEKDSFTVEIVDSGDPKGDEEKDIAELLGIALKKYLTSNKYGVCKLEDSQDRKERLKQ